MKNIKVLLVDDHDLVRYALRHWFNTNSDEFHLTVISEADNGRTAVELASRLSPDLIFMDVKMPLMNGIEATHQIRSRCPHCRIIILTAYNRRNYLRELIKFGVSGYVLKSHALEHLPLAIQAALAGEIYLCTRAAQLMAEDYAEMIDHVGSQTVSHKLTGHQTEVLQLMVEGKTTKEIAAMLHVSPKAIESVRHRIMQKLEMDNLADLTKYAIQEGITMLDF